MLTEKERFQKWESFRDGPSFGKHTWITLQLHNVNIGYLTRLAELYWILIRRLQRRDINGTYDDLSLLRIEQLVAIDSISRIQSGIEATLVLFHSLNEGYSDVAQSLTYYPALLPRQVAQNIRDEKYNIQKVFGLYNISKLGIDAEEKKVLAKVYQDTADTLQNMLETLADFYDRYRIIYGKTKHGLTIQSGAGLNTGTQAPKFDESMLFVLDRKEESDMPAGYLRLKSTDPLSEGWFNAQSVIQFGERLENDISAALKTLEEVSRYLSWNHMLYAQNCGEPFIPMYKEDERRYKPWFYGKLALSTDELKLLDSGARKVFNNMSIVDVNLFIRRDIKNQDVQNAMTNNPVVNLWFAP